MNGRLMNTRRRRDALLVLDAAWERSVVDSVRTNKYTCNSRVQCLRCLCDAWVPAVVVRSHPLSVPSSLSPLPADETNIHAGRGYKLRLCSSSSSSSLGNWPYLISPTLHCSPSFFIPLSFYQPFCCPPPSVITAPRPPLRLPENGTNTVLLSRRRGKRGLVSPRQKDHTTLPSLEDMPSFCHQVVLPDFWWCAFIPSTRDAGVTSGRFFSLFIISTATLVWVLLGGD